MGASWQRRQVPLNMTGKVALTAAQQAAKGSVLTPMTEVSGVNSTSVRYTSLMAWRDKRFQIEIVSCRAVQASSATLRMWTNGGWQKVVSLPAEEVPDFTEDKRITVEDFEAMHEALLDRAMVVLA